MKIPTKLTIKGKQWKVRFKKDLAEDGDLLLGLADFEKRTIFLCKSIPPEDLPKIFLHELTHAVLHELHVTGNSGSLPLLVEEILCDGFSQVLLDLFELKWRSR